MMYCAKCGSELKGAKNYCIVCGAQQDKLIKELKAQQQDQRETTQKLRKAAGSESGQCFRCKEETEKKCFFCSEFVCRDHYTRMQPNKFSITKMTELQTQGEKQRINDGWRGYIVSTCGRCAPMKERKGLTQQEKDKLNLVEDCSWYKV